MGAAYSSALVEEMLSYLDTECVDQDSSSQVANFYANRTVFITGATGFIGKALVEKLVRSCRDIKRIYVLMREKRGKNTKQRLADLIESPIFARIRRLHNGTKLLDEKVRVVSGDITSPKFGISQQETEELAKEVSIVFNSAASVRFVEPIDIAVRNNIYSTSQLIEFCNQLSSLEALIHLSTAYSNCHKRDTIYEIFYKPPMGGEQIISTVQTLKQIQNEIHIYPNKIFNSIESGVEQTNEKSRSISDLQNFYKRNLNEPNTPNVTRDLLEEFTEIALRRSNRPNTYTFTKAISECYLLDLVRARPDRYLNDQIQVAIVRPSIVGGAWREPDVGFVDNYNGPTGAILSLYTGALQAMPGNGDLVADLVPVDMVTNMLICAGWSLITNKSTNRSPNQVKRDNGVCLFNFVSGYRNPLYWKQVTRSIAELAYKYPSRYLVRLPSSHFIRAGSFYNIYDLLNHKCAAMVQDFINEKILRKELTPRNSSLFAYGRIKAMTDTLTPFTSNQWRVDDANVCALHESLSKVDKQLFQFNVTEIDWTQYVRNYVIGARIYTLKDEAQNVAQSLKALKKRQTIYQVSMILLLLLPLFYYIFFHQ